MLDLSVHQVRSYARSGFLAPERGPRGEYLFSFQDLVLLRTAERLVAKRVPVGKVRRVLTTIKNRLPENRPLSAVQILTDGEEVLVRDGDTIWSPESGQAALAFDNSARLSVITPHTPAAAPGVEPEDPPIRDLDTDEWYGLGADLETAAPDHAREAYRRTLELSPFHVEARVNLGRLLHEAGQLRAAEAHYRLALTIQPGNGTALFNLGVSQEDLGKSHDAIDAYRAAIESDPNCADAYYNLARLLEQVGDSAAALGYLQTYRKLTDQE